MTQLYQKLDDLRLILLSASDSDKRLILNKILQKPIYGDIFVKMLLSGDRIDYSKDRQALFDAIKEVQCPSTNEKSHEKPINFQRYEGYLNESKEKVFQRKIAELGPMTSSPEELLLNPLFLEHEIANVSKIKKEEFLECNDGSFLKKTTSENNKIVLHQQSMKSCGQTCVAMLLMDLGFSPDLDKLHGHLTNHDQRLPIRLGQKRRPDLPR